MQASSWSLFRTGIFSELKRRHSLCEIAYAKWTDTTGELSKKHLIFLMVFCLLNSFAFSVLMFDMWSECTDFVPCKAACIKEFDVTTCAFNATSSSFHYPYSSTSKQFALCLADHNACSEVSPCPIEPNNGTSSRALCGLNCVDVVGRVECYAGLGKVLLSGILSAVFVTPVKFLLHFAVKKLFIKNGACGGKWPTFRKIFGVVFISVCIIWIAFFFTAALIDGYHVFGTLLSFLTSTVTSLLVYDPIWIPFSCALRKWVCSPPDAEKRNDERAPLMHQDGAGGTLVSVASYGAPPPVQPGQKHVAYYYVVPVGSNVMYQ